MIRQSVRETLEQRLLLAGMPTARHVFTCLTPDTARAEADASDARHAAGKSLGPLDGLIVSIKDLFDVAGSVTMAGARMRRDHAAATADAPVVTRLRQAGAVLIGRSNMVEFAFSGLGLNPHFGTPGNVADQARIPGGSTSGGAVSVGLGIADVALGSDTGGSTRIPAAFNGIVGYKPTSARIPRDGAFPLSYTLDSVGPLARTVSLCAATDAVLAGIDPETLPVTSLKGLRVGIPGGILFTDTMPEVAAAFEDARLVLESQGAVCSAVQIDDLILQMREVLTLAPIAACEAAAIHAEALSSAPSAFDPRVRVRILGGQKTSATDYIRALAKREDLKKAFAGRMAMMDVLALPTVAITAPLISPLEADDVLYTAQNNLVLRNTSMANFFDVPAISLPLPVQGLPVGLMLVGAPLCDRYLFGVAAAVEQALGQSN